MDRGALPGRTLIIANPQAQSGAGARVAGQLKRFLELYLAAPGSFDLVETQRPRHATEIARTATGYRTVIALGGDGVIHETVMGLMQIPADRRPILGVLPVGSGNDYAQTLGIPPLDGTGFATLLTWRPRPMDVGCIRYHDPAGAPGCAYFVETCSVGLDAAIALGTYDLRAKTHLKGYALYTLSGLNVFGRAYRTFPLGLSLDGAAPQRLTPHLITVQIGPTYGSGYRVCPDADPGDGLFDVCWAAGPAPRAVTLPVFLAAKQGRHTGSRIIHIERARTVSLELDAADYPIQTDGERLRARDLSITCIPHALNVLTPA